MEWQAVPESSKYSFLQHNSFLKQKGETSVTRCATALFLHMQRDKPGTAETWASLRKWSNVKKHKLSACIIC